MFRNPFRVKPYESRLTEEEYQKYKQRFIDSLGRQLALNCEFPDIRCDDKNRHIVLFDFKGCLMGTNTIVIPEGVTIVYVEASDLMADMNVDSVYNLVLSDTVQYIDALPFRYLTNFDTNRLEAIRVNNMNLMSSCGQIDTVIVREDFNSDISVGHFIVNNLFYSMNKRYKLNKNQTFLAQANPMHVTNIYVDGNCELISLGDRKAQVHVCLEEGQQMPKIKLNRRSLFSVKNVNYSMEEALDKVINQ